MSIQLRDSDVREATLARLLSHARTCPDTLIINELGIEHGSSRVDIAVINGHIRGLEIKAEADSLSRLPRQIEAYGKVVDRATLIAAERHVPSASAILPDWWGLISVVRTKTGAIRFDRLRAEKANRSLQETSVAKLLWRAEVVEILTTLGVAPKLLRRPRPALYAELVSRVPSRRLRSIVRETLKRRTNWRDRERPS